MVAPPGAWCPPAHLPGAWPAELSHPPRHVPHDNTQQPCGPEVEIEIPRVRGAAVKAPGEGARIASVLLLQAAPSHYPAPCKSAMQVLHEPPPAMRHHCHAPCAPPAQVPAPPLGRTHLRKLSSTIAAAPSARISLMSRTSLSREGEGALPGFAEDRENRCSDSHSSSSEDAPSVTSFPKLPASSDVAPDLGTVADRSICINIRCVKRDCSRKTSASRSA